MIKEAFYAHTNGPDRANWQYLLTHLQAVAELAASFSYNPEISKIAYISGLLHDLGKYSIAYQKRLIDQGLKVDHATAGAQAIKGLWGNTNKNILATVIAYCVSGHHTGLPDFGSVSDLPSEPTLYARLHRSLEDFSAYREEVDLSFLDEVAFP
jgi:CRISPR-associated endonuclease Cas3-HD